MAENQHIYAAIDLKSFYASVECVSRKLDTLTTNLVVADVTRSEKDHLPGGVAQPESLRHSWPPAAV